jgi:hypothetical protein
LTKILPISTLCLARTNYTARRRTVQIAPRPFAQLARRYHRLGLIIPRGILSAASATYYLPHRRRVGGDLGAIFAQWK